MAAFKGGLSLVGCRPSPVWSALGCGHGGGLPFPPEGNAVHSVNLPPGHFDISCVAVRGILRIGADRRPRLTPRPFTLWVGHLAAPFVWVRASLLFAHTAARLAPTGTAQRQRGDSCMAYEIASRPRWRTGTSWNPAPTQAHNVACHSRLQGSVISRYSPKGEKY